MKAPAKHFQFRTRFFFFELGLIGSGLGLMIFNKMIPRTRHNYSICNKITDVLRRTVVELLRKDPSIINDEDEASNTALHLAATEGHLKCCKELLERGAEVDARLARVFFL